MHGTLYPVNSCSPEYDHIHYDAITQDTRSAVDSRLKGTDNIKLKYIHGYLS